MTKKLKILLISVLFLVASVCVCAFAGCKVKYTEDELKEKYGLKAQITYFLNGTGGNFDDDSYIKHLHYEPDSMPMDIGTSSLISGSSALNVSDGYNFTGWYKVEIDEATGKPLYADGGTYTDGDKYDGTKRMSMTNDPYDFTKPLKEGEHVYLCGSFYEDIKLRVNLLCMPSIDGSEFNKIEYTEGNKTVTVEDKKEIEYGSRLIPKVGSGLTSNANAIQNKFSGYTVEGFYQKVEGTEDEYVPFNGWPVKYPDPDSEGKYHDIVLYVKMLKGEWDIVSTPEEVAKMFSLGSHDYYIKQDIDGGGREIRNIRRLTGTIWGGEGHTLKNFKVVNNSLTTTDKASIFGQVQDSAVIKNITLEDFTVNFTVANSGKTEDPDISFVANTIAAKATIENVSVSGTLNITLSTDKCLTTNTTENSWLFGDKDDATYDKIQVPYATCTIVDENGNDRIYTVGNNNNNQTEDL